MTNTTIDVAGMTCEHCVRSVTEELMAVPGVTDVGVELRPGDASPVSITSEGDLDPEAVRAAVAEAGYAQA
jgi:copper chaperone CopZ